MWPAWEGAVAAHVQCRRVESRDAEIRHLSHARGSRVESRDTKIRHLPHARGSRVVCAKSAILRMRSGRWAMDDGREAEPPSCSGVNGRVIEILGFAGKNTQSDTRLR